MKKAKLGVPGEERSLFVHFHTGREKKVLVLVDLCNCMNYPRTSIMIQ